jgi:hypothetical protein
MRNERPQDRACDDGSCVDAPVAPWHDCPTVPSGTAGRRDAWWFFFGALVVYALTSPGATAYDQYARFAKVLLEGSLSLPERPPHLEMAEYQGRAYFTNPPSPALAMLPVVWLAQFEPLHAWLVKLQGGWELPLGLMQTAVSIFLAALNVALARVGLGRLPLSRRGANWGAALFGFGTIHWYHSTIGSVWYFAHVTHALGMWLCIIEWFGKARPLLLGLWLAVAFWSRMETIVAVPFVLIARPECWTYPRTDELIPRLRWSWLFALATPLVAVLALNSLYNYVRFETIENWGYRMLIEKPEVAPMYPHGLLSIKYWPGHVHVLFKAKPIFSSEFPWVLPSVGGTAIYWTTPAFIYAFRAPLDRLTAACWVGIALFMSLLIQHCGTGMTQLGYRFALDFYPLLTILTIRGMDSREKPIRWWHVTLILISIVINAWSVWVLNILQIQKLW